MSLVADYDSDSESSASSNESEDEIKPEVKTEPVLDAEEKKLPPPTFKLPTPKFDGNKNTSVSKDTGSVFGNPFLEAENAKQAILQKHVKMTDTKDVIVINGKKICWNYRKGRCRFGHNCKYAHDSDIQKTQEQLNAELEAAKAQSVICQASGSNTSATIKSPSLEEIEAIKEESKLDSSKKRKRPGLTQGLVPGKKVMNQYLSNKT